MVGNGENADNQNFFLFPERFNPLPHNPDFKVPIAAN